MNIIAEYELLDNTSDQSFLSFSVSNTGPATICPECQCSLKHRDWRPRICKNAGGTVRWISVERGKCPECGHLHTILPDMLAPNKHYETKIISGVIEGTITPDDEETEDYPCQETMRRWILWFAGNYERIEGYLRNALMFLCLNGFRIPEGAARVFPELRKQTDRWLETTLRIITNTGGRLEAFY